MVASKRTPRKKTARACTHCHKAHMTCDDERPCKRCISKNLSDTCVDAPRKKKKYLMDVHEGLEKASVAAPMTSTSSAASIDSVQSHILPQSHHQHNRALHDHPQQLPQQVPQQLHEQLHEQKHPEQSNPLHQLASPHPHHVDSLNFGQHHQNSKFMSNAANSEYSILSDIIRQEDYMNMQHRTRSITPGPPDIYTTLRQGDKSINQYMLGHVQDQLLTYPQVRQHIEGERLSEQEPGKKGALSFSIAFDDQAEYSPLSPFGLRFKDSEDIYSKIGSPFSYTPGFHSLIRYLKQRFNRQDLIKMAKAMSSYRPSFIACTNTLKEDDLIFMEQCFQRTLLEYDKFISTSGTPTIVWRRTGQIAYVSEEFCILTGWTKEELLNKVTFIVELMDDPSVVEYFNLFSTIAYGDFRGATMAGCTLITQDRSTIKTTCMWTLKRDVFGIPMMIVGNFLPILQ